MKMTWKDPVHGQDGEQIWYSGDDNYRIVWRSKFMGVKVTPKFVACAKVEVNEKPMWDLIGRHNKLGPAQATCRRHARQQKKLAQVEQPKIRRRKTVKRGSILESKKPF